MPHQRAGWLGAMANAALTRACTLYTNELASTHTSLCTSVRPYLPDPQYSGPTPQKPYFEQHIVGSLHVPPTPPIHASASVNEGVDEVMASSMRPAACTQGSGRGRGAGGDEVPADDGDEVIVGGQGSEAVSEGGGGPNI